MPSDAGGRPNVLVVAATEVEARYVPAGLPLLVTGIGKVAAATATTEALTRLAGTECPRVVINVGTAGALRDGLDGLHLPGTVINHDLSAELIRALGVDVTDRIDLDEGGDLVLATGDCFVADPVQRATLAERADLVDMEGFAVAWACARAGVRCVLVKHVSDNADGAAVSWAEVVDRSARSLGEWLGDWLAGAQVV